MNNPSFVSEYVQEIERTIELMNGIIENDCVHFQQKLTKAHFYNRWITQHEDLGRKRVHSLLWIVGREVFDILNRENQKILISRVYDDGLQFLDEFYTQEQESLFTDLQEMLLQDIWSRKSSKYNSKIMKLVAARGRAWSVQKARENGRMVLWI